MNTRFYNAKILTMGKNFDIIEGELWVQDELITHIGKPTTPMPVWDKEIDANGNLLMPSFKNAHSHSAMTFLRSYADDLPLHEWLHNTIFPMEAKLTSDDAYWLTKLAILEYVSGGISACFDMYFYSEAIAKASIESGFRMAIVTGLNNFQSSVEEIEKEYARFNNMHPLISYFLGFHAEYTCSLNLLKDIAKLANKLKAPVYTHNSETKREVDECIKRYGKTPTAFLNSLGMFNYGGGGYHCVHLTNEDMDIFKNHNMWVVTNPAANTKLASGIAPITDMMNKGINLALGTDGPAGNNCLDMFREMFLVTGLAKLKEKNASAVDAISVLKMATFGSAMAMGLDKCNYLDIGKLADIIMIDLQTPNMQPINNIIKNIVYSGNKQNIKLTMVNGKILYENGKFNIGVEPCIIYKKANEIISRIKSQHNQGDL